MKRSRFSDEQIIGILKEHQAGMTAAELRRKHGISPSQHLLRICLPGSGCDVLQMAIKIWWHALHGR